ncbi:cytochrome P450 [Microbacterium sp. NPDC055903]
MSRLAVVVPVFNEAAGIRPTLQALAFQDDDDFDAVFVDNASTDASADVIRAFISEYGMTRWTIVHEPEKGTGAAADTGMRAAIASGAELLARTDADCLPRADWTASVRRALSPRNRGGLGLELVGGELVPRRDEGLGWPSRAALRGAVHVAEAFGRVRPGNQDDAYLGPYMMAAGCNVGITADLYERAGGFPRTRIEDLHEDRALVNAVRRLTRAYARRGDVVVYGSSRRVQAWGLANTLLWYKDHAYRPAIVDIRDPASVSRPPRTSIALARKNERRLLRAAHPVAFPIVDAVPGPVRRLPGLGVIVKDASLLRETLMDTDAFRKTGPGSSGELWTPVLGPRVLLNMEGEDHRELRRKLAPLFSPSFVDTLVSDAIGTGTARFAARLAAGEPVDLVAHARWAASAVISRLVGLDTDVVDDDFFRRSAEITGYVSLARPSLAPRQLAHAKRVLQELDVHASRAYAGDESTVPGRMRALGLDESEALGAVGAFVLTGTETLVSFLPRLAAILIDTGWLPRLAADPSLTEAAVAEALRVTTPTPMMIRSAARPARIGDVEIRAGERILLGTYWANRALGEFDPKTNPSAQLKQLWFGAGVHFCIGAPLAMAQIRALLAPLLAAPDLRVNRRRATRHVLIPAYSHLEVQRR